MSNNWESVLAELERGTLRAANKVDGKWVANVSVKEAILNAFRAGELVEEGPFVDKHTVLTQSFKIEQGIRVCPGGTSVRKGSYIAKGVVIMPPAYVNIGAYVDSGTMIDSHALVGSCAQIGKNVHLSAGVQIGGVLEPIGLAPVVIEDNCFIGAGSVIVEGIQVLQGAVIAAGVTLSLGVPVYDTVNNRILDRGEPIPANAIVVPGSRPLNKNKAWGNEQGLSVSCAIIIKYRDEKSEASLELEESLR